MLLSSYVSPHMLNQIVLQLYVGSSITHVTMKLDTFRMMSVDHWAQHYHPDIASAGH